MYSANLFLVSDPGDTGGVTKRREREIEKESKMKRDWEKEVEDEAGMKRDREGELKMKRKRERERECSGEKKIEIEGEIEEVGAREQGRMREERSGKQMEGGVGTAVESGKECEETKALQGLHLTQYVHNILFEDISYCGKLLLVQYLSNIHNKGENRKF